MFNIASYNDSIANIPGTDIHIYTILVTAGILLAILASWIKMYRRSIPTKTLEGAILIVIPLGLIGARLWYDIGDISRMKNWIDIFAVWDGGMAIEGGVITGLIVGLIIFYRASQKYQISMWVYLDCILPNVLLGQAIGRWGNFFNQELLGHDIGHPFSWLPAFFNDHLHYYGESVEVYRQPLFLYESIVSFSGWIILAFVVPKVGFWFSKKPWKVEAENFKLLTVKDIEKRNYLLTRKNEKNIFTFMIKWLGYKFIFVKNKIILLFKNWTLKHKHWEAAYFDFEPGKENIKEVLIKPYKPLKVNPNMKFWQRTSVNHKNFWRSNLHKFNQDATPLNQSYNPNQYRLTYAGVSGALYFAFYGIIRTIMEPFRDARDIMLIGPIPISIVTSVLWIILGITLFIFAQFIASKKFRQKGWYYERQY